MDMGTLTRKGQVTIPGKIRKFLGLRAGDRVEFLIDENNRVILRPVIKRVEDVYGRLKGKRKFSLEKMENTIREKLKEKWKTKS